MNKKNVPKKRIVKERFEKIKKLRKQDGLDVRFETLAKTLHVSLKTAKNYAYGLSPVEDDILKKLCDYLDVSEEWIIGLEDLPENELGIYFSKLPVYREGIKVQRAEKDFINLLKKIGILSYCAIDDIQEKNFPLYVRLFCAYKHDDLDLIIEGLGPNEIETVYKIIESMKQFACINGQYLDFDEWNVYLLHLQTCLKDISDQFISLSKHILDNSFFPYPKGI